MHCGGAHILNVFHEVGSLRPGFMRPCRSIRVMTWHVASGSISSASAVRFLRSSLNREPGGARAFIARSASTPDQQICIARSVYCSTKMPIVRGLNSAFWTLVAGSSQLFRGTDVRFDVLHAYSGTRSLFAHTAQPPRRFQLSPVPVRGRLHRRGTLAVRSADRAGQVCRTWHSRTKRNVPRFRMLVLHHKGKLC